MTPANKKDIRAFGRCVIGWVPVNYNIAYKVNFRYWDSKYKMWSSGEGSAYPYRTYKGAEKTAFKLVANDPSLIGEVEVVEVTAPEKLEGLKP